jgi:capsular polysaccharide transport system ATP-binding protein
MIRLEGLTKAFPGRAGMTVVADRIDATFPTGRSVALLGRNGAGKSTLLQMIAGTMDPDAGRILSTGSISWPVGFAGAFHPDLTGAQNTRFIARVYGVDTAEMAAFVRDFAQLGAHFDRPVRTYSAGMRSRLAFGASMAVPFDTYLVDEVTSVGDAAFRRRSSEVFAGRMRAASAIVVSHSMPLIRQFCDAAALLKGGRLCWFNDLEAGIAAHEEMMATA